MARGMLTSYETEGIGSRLAEMTPWESRQGGLGPPSPSHSPSRECLWIVKPTSLNQLNKSET